MFFSDRVPANLALNRLARAREEARAAGTPIIDLTESNPTHVRVDYPADLLAALGRRCALDYAPEPLGLFGAREAVAAEYRRRQISLPPERVVLTSSTSEAYALLFKVFCDPGDEVLIPSPSYPLFDHLTRLEGVVAVPYDLQYHAGWSFNLPSIDAAFSLRTRALIIVTPNNPTGSFIKPSELEYLAQRCASKGIPLIADEVFADYELTPGARLASGKVLADREVLAISLGGLSKSVGLPQAKLAWMGLNGTHADVADTLARLEVVCDSYLSVSTPVQMAAAEVLSRGAGIRRQIQTRIDRNYRQLKAEAEGAPACTVLAAEGGWNAVIQVPSYETEEDLVLQLLADEGVLVHPGYFFDFPKESFLIVSLLVEEGHFVEGTSRVFRRFGAAARR